MSKLRDKIEYELMKNCLDRKVKVGTYDYLKTKIDEIELRIISEIEDYIDVKIEIDYDFCTKKASLNTNVHHYALSDDIKYEINIPITQYDIDKHNTPTE